MTPYRGLGANTAIADGVAFALMLAKCLNKDWRPALAEYEASMRQIGNEAAAQSRSTARFFHSDSIVGVLARDGMLKAGASSLRLAAFLNKK